MSSWLLLAALSSIALVALLTTFGTRHAVAYPLSPAPGISVVDEEGDEAEAESEDEGEDGSEEEEEWEEEEAEPLPADVCPLRSASAHAISKHDKLKLTISYTTNEPFSAGVEVKLGPTRVDSVQRHFGRSGVLRLSTDLDEPRKGGRLVVRLKLPAGSAECPSRRLVLFPR